MKLLSRAATPRRLVAWTAHALSRSPLPLYRAYPTQPLSAKPRQRTSLKRGAETTRRIGGKCIELDLAACRHDASTRTECALFSAGHHGPSPPASTPAKTTTPLFTRAFILLCGLMFFGYANHWIISPILPLYVNDLGGSAFVAGLALLAFSAPSVVFRPYVGQLADRF